MVLAAKPMQTVCKYKHSIHWLCVVEAFVGALTHLMLHSMLAATHLFSWLEWREDSQKPGLGRMLLLSHSAEAGQEEHALSLGLKLQARKGAKEEKVTRGISECVWQRTAMTALPATQCVV
jgi:hypothetical protein